MKSPDWLHVAQQPAAQALVEALFPAGQQLPAPDVAQLLARADHYMQFLPGTRIGVQALILMLQAQFLVRHRQRFSHAPVAERQAFLREQQGSALWGPLLQLLSLPLRAAYLLDDATLRRVDTHNGLPPVKQIEQARWQTQISCPDDLDTDTELEADVVVIGTGAGGAAAAYELATRGLAVVLLEEGAYHDRRDFNGRLTEVVPKLYRGYGGTVALGNAVIPVPVGRSVGGTTTINSGTCMRTPDAVLADWQAEGLRDFTADAMAPFFEQVEAMLSVQRATPETVGPVGDVIERGAHALGFTQTHPLMRNAVGCDGQGLCQFGCPTDAKQSTNVSYVPRALAAGAFLFTGQKAERLLWRGKQITGVQATSTRTDGRVQRLRVMAPKVVVAMGSFFTPLFLQANGVRSRWLGRNLSIHPAGAAIGYYPGMHFRNTRSIPQGYGVSDWAGDGIMFEGGTPPFVAHGLLSPWQGEAFVNYTERYQQMAYFGFMIKDTSRGSVRNGPHADIPLIHYHMNDHDFSRFLRGLEALTRMHLAAGAEEVYWPGLTAFEPIRDETMLAKRMKQHLRPRQFALSAYHPLGTARIAPNPGNGVCDSDHQVFGRQGLYVMDGSSVPGSLGANPQVTIMAMALRAAKRIADTQR